MKKLALLLGTALLAACGGGGGTGVPTAGNGSGDVVVVINETKQTMKTYTSAATIDKNKWGRVVVTNPNLDDPSTGRVFKKYYDYRLDNKPALNFSLPYATGYVFEYLEYNATSGFKTYSTTATTGTGGVVIADNLVYPASNILKYARAENVTIGSAAVTITLTAKTVPYPGIKFPVTKLIFNGYSGVPAKSESATFQVKPIFSSSTTAAVFDMSKWNLTVRKKAVAKPTNITTHFSGLMSGNLATVEPPIVYANNEYMLRGIGYFYLRDSILLPGENYTKFAIGGASPFVPVVVKIKDVTLP